MGKPRFSEISGAFGFNHFKFDLDGEEENP